MLQRIQTVYLLLAGLSIGLLFVFNLSVIESINTESQEISSTENQSETVLNYAGFSNKKSTIIPYVFSFTPILILGLIAYSIFQFKKRHVQIKICQLNMLLMLSILLLIFYESESYLEQYAGESGSIAYQFGTALPIIGVVFNLLASRAIKKDEQLVRSANRIR